jgi:hypothetical protein
LPAGRGREPTDSDERLTVGTTRSP